MATIKISGHWFPAGASKRAHATLDLQGAAFTLHIAAPDVAAADVATPPRTIEGRITDLDISARIGNIPRVITFADRSVFETDANDELDRWLRRATSRSPSLAHALESKWRWAVAGVLVTVLFAFAGVRWVLPWSADRIAEWLPPPVVAAVSSGTLSVMDELFLDPSELSARRRQQLTRRFSMLAPAANDAANYTLHFRQFGVANAFALPSGEVVLSDQLVELADDLAELDAIMLHEIGHVVHLHGLKAAVRASFIALAFALVAGDPSGANELVSSLPVVLLQSHYSRAHESEADEYAFRRMLDLGIDPAHFAAIMTRIASADDADGADGGGESHGESVLDYLSTHPPTPERIERAIDYSEQFKRVVK